MKILFVSPTYPPIMDGGAMYIYRLSRELRKLGHNPQILANYSVYLNSLEPDYSWDDGCKVLPGLPYWDFRSGIIQTRKVIQSVYSQHKPDIVHVIFPSSRIDHGYYLPIWMTLERKPLITTYFSLSIRKSAFFLNRFVSIALALRSDTIISHDPLFINFWKRILPHKRNIVRFVPVGANFDFDRNNYSAKDQLRKELGLVPDVLYVAYFGNLDATRGFDTLLRSIAILNRKNFNVRLLVIGRGGELLNKNHSGYPQLMNELISSLNIKKNIQTTGFLDEEEIAKYLLSSDICCLPFRRNVLGRTSLMAALQLGIPTITTLTANLLESVGINNHSAIMAIPTNESSGLAQAIYKLGTDDALRKRMSTEAIRLARNFSIDRIAEKTLHIYKEVLLQSRFRRSNFNSTSHS